MTRRRDVSHLAAALVCLAFWAASDAGTPADAPSDPAAQYAEAGFREIESFGEQHVKTRVRVSQVRFSGFEDLPNPDESRWLSVNVPAGLSPDACPCRTPEALLGDTWIGIRGRDAQGTSFDMCFASKEVFAECLAGLGRKDVLDVYGVVVEVSENRRRRRSSSDGVTEEIQTSHEGYGLICEGIEVLPPEGEGVSRKAGVLVPGVAKPAAPCSYRLDDIPMPPLGEESDTAARRDTKRLQWQEDLKNCTLTVTGTVQDMDLLAGLVKYALTYEPIPVDRALEENQVVEVPVYDPNASAREKRPVECGKREFAIDAVRAVFVMYPIGLDEPACVDIKKGETVSVTGRIACVGCAVDMSKAFEYRNGVPLRTRWHVTVRIAVRLADARLVQ